MITVKQYEKFIDYLKKGLSIDEASKRINVDPKSMKDAIEKNPEVKKFIASLLGLTK